LHHKEGRNGTATPDGARPENPTSSNISPPSTPERKTEKITTTGLTNPLNRPRKPTRLYQSDKRTRGKNSNFMQGMAHPGGCGHSHWHQLTVAPRPPSLILLRCRRRRGHVGAMQGRKVQSARARSGGIQMEGGTISFGIPCSTRAGPSRP